MEKENSERHMSDVDLTSTYLNSIGKIRFRLLYLIDWKSTVSIILTLLDSNNLSQELKKYALLETGDILTG